MIYRREIRIEFGHCDPAGIVFYPRFFEMTNSVVESFFREVLLMPYDLLMRAGGGVPTVAITTEFHAPAMLEEVLEWRLAVTKVGRTSAGFHIEAHGDGRHRLSCDITLVHIAAGGRPQRWPDAVRARICDFMEKQ
ncbi:MAG: thioesterase family protein [Rubellimicrobium sp.]|nr:thioesterase family protein [Rubellimicrobium sp.]